ncbi:uncharacterized protein BX664DRAFT_334832 [Halteromyces radiatus]|uniref:uncharacterized protein n=1 Tax=Halteromyces radiatus TaxID=101107 RepID=UPI00221F2178|nr:uncharacterized protein BX664DRAFT_334832 [Halteromyces radiatus]KAI8086067.1 hypothetical protein BX664DRAFT_334832 [Halteromyces radiatus]
MDKKETTTTRPSHNEKQLQQSKRPVQLMEGDQPLTLAHTKRTKKAKSHGAEPLSGRLDFRPSMTDQVPESQLKAMSPKERRQLRNKISARNFRNRRKEYITTLEEELDECKSENKQLQQELTTLRNKVGKLEEENKQLRLDLVLYEEGINPAAKTSPTNLLHQFDHKTSPTPTSLPGTSSSSNLSSFELSPGTVHALSSDSSSASPPDLFLHDYSYHHTSLLTQTPDITQQQPQQEQQQEVSSVPTIWTMPISESNIHDMYLSHAMMPDWDVNQVLSKSNEQSQLVPYNNINVKDTFQRYPLLAPSLMSIVIGHTMSLSTNDLLKLNLPLSTKNNNNNNNGNSNNHPFDLKGISSPGLSPHSSVSDINDKDVLKIWELLQPFVNTRRNSKMITQYAEEEDHLDHDNDKNIDTENDDDSDADDDDNNNNNNNNDYELDGKCAVTTFVNSQMACFQKYLKMYVCASVQHVLRCRLEAEQQQQEGTTMMEEERITEQQDITTESSSSSTSRPCMYIPLCKRLQRAKNMFIPVS